MLKDHFSETLLLVLALVMGLLMSVAVILLDGISFNPSNIFKIWAMITLVIILVSIFLPYKTWSSAFCRRLGLKEESFGWKLADGIVPSLVLNTFNTLVVSAANIFYNETISTSEQMDHWLHGIIRDWPITLIISYFVAFIAEYCGKIVAKKCTKRT